MTHTQHMRLSKSSVVTTLLVYALILGAACYSHGRSTFAMAALIALAVTSTAAALWFMPLSASIDDEAFTLRFALRRKTLRRADIVCMEPYKGRRRFLRLCGSGGFLGWWGWFRSRELGNFFLYAASLEHLTVIELTDGRRYVVSCTPSF